MRGYMRLRSRDMKTLRHCKRSRAMLRFSDPLTGSQVPDPYEAVFTGMATLAFWFRGFERV